MKLWSDIILYAVTDLQKFAAIQLFFCCSRVREWLCAHLKSVRNRLLPTRWCIYGEKKRSISHWIAETTKRASQSLKVWVLNNGVPVPINESPYIWLGDTCVSRPDVWHAEVSTRLHLIANPKHQVNHKSTCGQVCFTDTY